MEKVDITKNELHDDDANENVDDNKVRKNPFILTQKDKMDKLDIPKLIKFASCNNRNGQIHNSNFIKIHHDIPQL